MKNLKFKGFFQKGVWKKDFIVQIDDNSQVISFEQDVKEIHHNYCDLFFPGFVNNHSHAFQYAMSGLGERIGPSGGEDNFWSWRNEMYALALSITPEKMLDVATALYKKLKLLGYKKVSEFHYLHHDITGKPYCNWTIMAEALLEASKEAKIALDLVPVYYRLGGFDQMASDLQKRFLFTSTDEYFKFIEDLDTKSQSFSKARVLCGIHSLRAAGQDEVKTILSQRKKNQPFHIHISEQVKEVDECIEKWGCPPVQWLLNQEYADQDLELVHATHINDQELKQIVDKKIDVVLCPSTEANLGDGIFPLEKFHKSGGGFSIGTDSHIGLNPFEEIRWLEYTQRLHLMKRIPLATSAYPEGVDGILSKLVEDIKIGDVLEGFLINSLHIKDQINNESKWNSLLVFRERIEYLESFTL